MRLVRMLVLLGLGLALTGCDDIKLLNVKYDPITAGAPRYTFDNRVPVAIVLPFRTTSATHYGPYHVGEFYTTIGTLEDRAFAEQTVNDIVAGGMADELNYSGFRVLDERNAPQFALDEAKLADLCRRLREKHPEADFAVGGVINRFWASAKSLFWMVQVRADVEMTSYVIDVREARIVFKAPVGGTRDGARQYVGAGRMKMLLQEALQEAVSKTLRNPQVIEFFMRVAARRAALPAETTAG